VARHVVEEVERQSDLRRRAESGSTEFASNSVRKVPGMFNLESGIDSLTNFKCQTADVLRQLHASAEPLVSTVNGKADVVVQDAAAY